MLSCKSRCRPPSRQRYSTSSSASSMTNRGALKACCLVSKSWIHRTREYLFAHVEFSMKSHIEVWKKAFPDPSNSPARYTRSLSIRTSQVVTSVDMGVGGWIRTFSGVVRLYVDISVDTTVVERPPSSRCVDCRPPSSLSTWSVGSRSPHPQKSSASCVPFPSSKISHCPFSATRARSTDGAFPRHHPNSPDALS
jgi:hypothetical protein